MDDTIRLIAESQFPELQASPEGWLWIKAQVAQESNFDPRAVSPVGAMGLLQIMPQTWAGLVHAEHNADPFEPLDNLFYGIRYLANLYRDFPEIPLHEDRLRLAFASYNGGKGYVNHALALGRRRESLPFGFQDWRRAGCPSGRWQTWQSVSELLPQAQVRGKKPDVKQIRDYVAKIEAKCKRYAV